jgi:hypothetical protein
MIWNFLHVKFQTPVGFWEGEVLKRIDDGCCSATYKVKKSGTVADLGWISSGTIHSRRNFFGFLLQT